MSRLNETLEEPFYEESVIYQNPLLFLKVWEIPIKASPVDPTSTGHWHYHREVEFLHVTAGQLAVQTLDHQYLLHPGDVLLLGSSQLHRTYKASEASLSFTVLQINLLQHFDQSTLPYLHCFSELTTPLEQLNYLFQEQPLLKEAAASLIADIYQESQDQQRGYELAVSSAVRKLMWLLLRHDTRDVLPQAVSDDLLRLRPVFDYIESNLHRRISVEEVSALLNISYHYFIRYFRASTGLHFIEFVNYKRIKKAERLLLTSEDSITDIALASGFSSMAQFYKQFRRFHRCSPSQLKHNMSASAREQIPSRK